jgi:hypothetical protein
MLVPFNLGNKRNFNYLKTAGEKKTDGKFILGGREWLLLVNRKGIFLFIFLKVRE